jgi:site-specific DNA recombinase
VRAAIYARFSTEKQRETSIDDQARVCRASAAARGWEVVALHQDEGTSGSTPVAARRGGAALLADALAGRIEALLLEGLDRLSRDLVEQETIVRRLEHRGIRILGVADGYDSESSARKLHRGMRGLINEVYLDDLRHKTHRGLQGQVQRGMAAGGIGFGYRGVPGPDGSRIEIDELKAQLVREIFQAYADGQSGQRIAADLNARRVPSPRGGTWAVSALYGSPAKGSGILHNEAYIGRLIWNRSMWVKDPDTKRRQRIDRPRSEWVIVERPELRIVPQELWEAVRSRFEAPRREGGGRGAGPRPMTLLGGLMTCARCGGAMVAVSARAYGCAARKDRGPAVCQGTLVRRDVAEVRLLAEVREMLLAPESVAEMRAEVARLVAEQGQTGQADQAAAKARIKALEAEVTRMVDAIATVGVSEALADRLRRTEAELAAVRMSAATAAARGPDIDPDAVVAAYRELLADLGAAVSSDIGKARQILGELLGRVVITTGEDGTFAELETTTAAVAAGASLKLVAGARFVHRRRIRLR